MTSSLWTLLGNYERTSPARRLRPQVESLEDRLALSWGSVPPANISVPSSFTSVNLNSAGDATGNDSITSNEIDWYRFTAVTGGSYIFEATTPSSNLDTVIATYTSTGSRVGYNDDIGGGNTDSRFTVTLTAGQVYFFGVTNYTGTAGGSYAWKIDGPAAPTDDAYEDNDTQATAWNLGTLTSTQTLSNLVMNDAADWFRFTTSGTGTSANSVSISFTHSQGDLDLKLFNSAGTQIGISNGTGNSESISLNGLAAGTYFVQVYGYNGAKNPNYSLTINPPASGPTTNAWTIFVYITASDLHTFARDDINEMENAASRLPSNVKIVAFWDQSSRYTTYATGNGTQAAWGTAGRAVIQGDTASTIRTTFEILGEQNTGNPTTLANFLTWGATAAPASNYALILWNHGAGIYGSNYDDSDGTAMDFLTINEVATALGTAGVPAMKLVSYDACLMGMAEIGYTLRNTAPVFAASEELEAGTGHDYTTLFNSLMSNPASVTPEQLGAGFVTSFGNQYVGRGMNEDTYSAIRTAQYGNLATALKTFTDATLAATAAERTAMQTARNNAIMYDGTSYRDFRDLGSFMRNIANNTSIATAIRNAANGVITAINNAVISKTNDRRSSSGIAIYLPSNSMDANYTTNFSGFNTATGWGSFVNWLITGTRSGGSTSGGSGGRSVAAQRTVRSVETALTNAEYRHLAAKAVEFVERAPAALTSPVAMRTSDVSTAALVARTTRRESSVQPGQDYAAWKKQVLAKVRQAAVSATFADYGARHGRIDLTA
jgi:hypothetical protein